MSFCRLSLFSCALVLALCVQLGGTPVCHAGVESERPPAEVPRGRLTLHLDPGGHLGVISRALFTPDSKQLITLSDDHSVRIWDVGTWQTSKVIYPPGGGYLWVADLSPDGRTLAVAAEYWETGKAVPVIYLFALPQGQLERTLRGHTALIEGLAFSPDGKRLASSGGRDKTTRVWDLTGDKPPRVIPSPWGKLSALAFSTDGKRLARVRDESCQIIDATTGKEVVGYMKGSQVAWSPDGKTLATRGPGPNLGFHLWEPDGKQRFHLLDKRAISSLTFSPDSRAVLAVWGEQHAKGNHNGALFDVTTGKRLAHVPDSKPSLFVLAVGINAYPGALKLRCAVNDATRLQGVLERHGKAVYGKIETKLLTDERASQKGILDGFAWLKQQMTPRDVAVIFYAGHGVRDQKGQFYLLPQDGDPDDLEKTAVSSKVFRDNLVNLPGRLLVLLDACNSGAVGGITDDLARVLVDDDCGVVVMCAATGTEESREDKAKGHGYFTLSLIEGLEGKASRNSRDGAVYLHHLQQYVIDRVQVLSDDAQHPVSAVPMSVRSFALAKP